MKPDDYPALYRSADTASNQAQADFLLWLKVNNVLLVLAAVTSLIYTESKPVAIMSVVLFLASLFVYMHIQHQNFRARWYQARALAESVKTATWRLMMSAEPFAHVNETVNIDKFRTLLSELLVQNTSIGAHLTRDLLKQEQVTTHMVTAMRNTFDEKKSMYLAHRIDEQCDWYARKSAENRQESKKYFALVCGVYGIALVLLVVRVGWPGMRLLPVDVLAVVASSIIGWVQMKRFDELASSYGLTAHEVGIIRSRYQSVTTAAQLSGFVSDAENAFSREHTQWAARRDH